MEELKRSFDYTVTPQYLVAEKDSVDAGEPPKFRSRDRPNTTDSYHLFQQEVSFKTIAASTAILINIY
jgi:hypothetical protein